MWFKALVMPVSYLVPTPDFVSKLATPLADTKFGKSLPHLKTYSTFVENGTPALNNDHLRQVSF